MQGCRMGRGAIVRLETIGGRIWAVVEAIGRLLLRLLVVMLLAA